MDGDTITVGGTECAITAGGTTTALTVTPAITWEISDAVLRQTHMRFRFQRDVDGWAGEPLRSRATFTGTSPAYAPQGWFTTHIPGGESRPFGSYRSDLFNNSTGDIELDFINATDQALDVTGITCAVLRLPWYDGLTGETSGTDTNDELSIPLGTATNIAAEQIVPEGMDPTFTAHSDADGWAFALGNERRRFAWIKNNTGGQKSLIPAGLYPPDNSSGWLSSASAVAAGSIWRSIPIGDGEEFLLGPWDERVWNAEPFASTFADRLWLRATGGIEANLTTAWLDLAP